MSNEKKNLGLNIETLVLVAVWKNPFIFQGCFKVSELNELNTTLFFFRCQSSHIDQTEILYEDFSSYVYKFTHLYDESGLIPLNDLEQTQEYALYLLKYALHVTLREMLSSRKQNFISIDDIAMQEMIKSITPVLNRASILTENEHVGFAVAMDFCPDEEIGSLAASTLLQKLK